MPVIQTSADPGFEDFVSVMDMACCGKPMRLAIGIHVPRKSGLGKGMWLKVRVALHLSLPSTLILASVIA